MYMYCIHIHTSCWKISESTSTVGVQTLRKEACRLFRVFSRLQSKDWTVNSRRSSSGALLS